MGSRPGAQSPLSVNKTSQWQLACVFCYAHPTPQCRYKRRANANAHQFFAEEPRLCAPAVQRWYSNCGDGTLRLLSLLQGMRVTYVAETFPFSQFRLPLRQVTDVNGIPMKTPLLLTPSSALQKPASPPTPVGTKDRTGLRQKWQPLLFRTVGMDNTGIAYSK